MYGYDNVEYEHETSLTELFRNFIKQWKKGLLIIFTITILTFFGCFIYNKISSKKAQTIIVTKAIQEIAIEMPFENAEKLNITNSELATIYSDRLLQTSGKSIVTKKVNDLSDYDITESFLKKATSISTKNNVITISVELKESSFTNILDKQKYKYNQSEIEDEMKIETLNICNEEINYILSEVENSSYNLVYEKLTDEPIYSYSNKTINDKSVDIKKYTVLGFVGGLLIYCLYILIVSLKDKTIKTLDELNEAINNLPIILKIAKNNKIDGYKSFEEILSYKKEQKIILVTSPLSNNDELIKNISSDKILLINANNRDSKFEETCDFDKVTSLIKENQNKYEHILVIGPALNNYYESLALLKECDGVILTLPFRTFTKDDLKASLNLIEYTNSLLMGCVVSDIR